MIAAAMSARCWTVLVLTSASASRTLSAAKALSQASAVVSPLPAVCPRYLVLLVVSTSHESSSLCTCSSSCVCCTSTISFPFPNCKADDFCTLSLRPDTAENRLTACRAIFCIALCAIYMAVSSAYPATLSGLVIPPS
ncbi:hypothetical protein PR001_g28289 [Phytophthora rubi]|uniref:Secreted protein n=1 Tax=Phytophthora rubi TaxID=129364 RepID=A0A6A3HC72_9STRA|nr:hypothetical protein PR001_g28289 [Phytophthora rubi]